MEDLDRYLSLALVVASVAALLRVAQRCLFRASLAADRPMGAADRSDSGGTADLSDLADVSDVSDDSAVADLTRGPGLTGRETRIRRSAAAGPQQPVRLTR